MVKLKNNGESNGTYEWEYAKKIDNRTTRQKIMNFIYDPVTHAFMGRTAKSWGGLLLFYAIFYSVLALLFSVCMNVLLASLTKESPKWQLEESLIGGIPGLGFRPMAEESESASIIWYNETTKTKWVDSILEFQKRHYLTNSTMGRSCTYNDSSLRKDEFCKVDWDKFGYCKIQYGFGYGIESPCVFIKLNRIFGWVPQYYNDSNDLPSDIPENAVSKIKEHMKTEPNQVWLSCEGQSDHDKENVGTIEYNPGPGFPHYYYPYLNTKNYMSPLVAVQFKKAARNVLINIECKAWARNIIHSKSSQVREGSVHFEIQID